MKNDGVCACVRVSEYIYIYIYADISSSQSIGNAEVKAMLYINDNDANNF